nr:metalloendoproteinase 1-MMP-like [Ziziphus jujuba var. spinosa]
MQADPWPHISILQLPEWTKGQSAKDIPNLKRYLKKFGYLNNYDEATLNNDQDDYFDDTLESAVKLYQKNYNLSVTGKLVSATIKQMSLPRCGVPDNVQYVIPGAQWPPNKYHLTYAFNSSKQPALPPEDVRTTVAFAFTLWTRNSVFSFQEVDLGQPHDLVLGFRQGLLMGLMEFWPIIADPPGTGLLWVSLHEIGQLLGMGHSLDPLAVMLASITPGIRRKDLNADDVAGIHALYATP